MVTLPSKTYWDRFADTPPAPCHRFEVNPKSLHPFSFDLLTSTPNHFKSLLDKPSQRQPKIKENLPQTLPNAPKILPNPFPNRPKIDSEALLEPILGQCLKKIGFWTSKKQPRGVQECQDEAQDRPRASQIPSKWSSRPSKIQFINILFTFILQFQIYTDFSSILYRFFANF